MKQIIKILPSMILILPMSAQSQSQTTFLGKNYITNVSHIKFYGVGADDKKTSQFFYASKATKFTIVGLSADKELVIVFWDFKNTDKIIDDENKIDTLDPNYTRTYDDDKSVISTWANKKDFILPLDNFENTCSVYNGGKSDFTWGAMTLPIKTRFGNDRDRQFNVEENLNLGLAAGFKRQLASRHLQSINILAVCAMGRALADSASIKNYTPTGSSTPVQYPVPSTKVTSALSTGVGVMYQYEKSFQVGVFIGVDHSLGEFGKYWKYQGKPWLGIAFGISLFNEDKSDAGTQGKNDPGK